MDTPFKPRVWLIKAATCYKSALYGIEYAPGVETNVYADSRDDAVSRMMGVKGKTDK